MKTIKISLYANLRKTRSHLTNRGALTTGAATIGDLLAELDITEAEAALVLLNAKRAGIFPILGGG